MRLKVSYKTPEALLSEFTRSVGRGGVTIESKKSLPVGTRFVFELRAQGVRESRRDLRRGAEGHHDRRSGTCST